MTKSLNTRGANQVPMSKSLLSYADIRGVMDQALASEKGVRVRCDSLGQAYNLRQRFYSYRLMDRKENAKIYQPGDPLYNTSAYDKIIVLPEGDSAGNYWLRLEVSTAERLEARVEEL